MASLRFAPPAVDVERLSGGRLLLRSPLPLGPVPRAAGDVLEKWAAVAPDRPFLAEADAAAAGDGFRRVTYGEALRAARALGQALLDRDLGPARPLAILSGNSVDHALLFNILHADERLTMLKEARRVLAAGGKLAVIHWNYDPSTPRGPSMSIRPRPDECHSWAEQVGFVLLPPGLIDLPPYHYGFVFELPL